MTIAAERIHNIDDIRARFAARAFSDADESGDFTFNRDLEGIIRSNATKDAAVLIGLHDKGIGDPNVLLTQRTESLRTHSGQIAFPGGRIDDTDADAVAAALRECEEETGIGSAYVDVVGVLPTYLSGSGFRIKPVIAELKSGYTVTPNPGEVETVFEVPLSFLMDPANHQHHSREWSGKKRYFYAMPYGDRYIWGVTAGIIRMMYERLYA